MARLMGAPEGLSSGKSYAVGAGQPTGQVSAVPRDVLSSQRAQQQRDH